ncbi:zinc finger protein 431-like [Cydia pomonella]|uniref:zinc finger protein 431-like n=1 Tax=Cydia pomonella TaxID=82600 RepID=UPI002ADDFB00|nr:zinc finger protein 431-like [Cydia pomonella]
MSLRDRERFDQNEKCPSEAGSLESLYADHEIEEDLVIGPVEIWKPKITLKFIGLKTKPKDPVKTIEKDMKPPYSTRQKNLCKLCNKEFKNANRLEEHIITHSNDRPFSCNICNKRYKRESTLYAHKYTHENKKPYKCKHCRKSFTFKGQLKAHTRLHTGEKPYKCNICSKEFTQQTSLNNHLLKHKGIKPHCCEICHERFRQVSNLKKHLETNHSDKKKDIQFPKEKGKKHKNTKAQKEKKEKQRMVVTWYACKKCKFVFSSNDDLSKHKKLYHGGM